METYKLKANYKKTSIFQGTFYDADGLDMAKEIAKLLSDSDKFSQVTITFQEDKKIDFLEEKDENI